MGSAESRRLKNAQAAVDFIEKHLDGSLSLDRTAAAVHYSKYHLHRIFADTTGMTIHDYTLRRQLTEGARRLVRTDQPVLEIALSCGYGSQQAFTSAFREMYKLPPAQYRARRKFYPLQLPFSLGEDGTSEELSPENIRPAVEEDIPAWLELVRQSVDGYPCLDEADYLRWLKTAISGKRALILKAGDTAAGVLGFGFSGGRGTIEYLGIHPRYRKQEAAELLVREMSGKYLPGRKISMTTYRSCDRADTGWRAILKKLGFEERELLTEFGYPTQRFVLRPGPGGE